MHQTLSVRRHAGPCPAVAPPPLHRAPARSSHVARAADPADLVTQLSLHLPLLSEPVALPCSLQQCGDVVYRSTLDPVLRKEVESRWEGLALLAAAAGYLLVPPGVLAGAIDYYFTAPLSLRDAVKYSRDDFTMGRKLGAGGFGSVYKAELRKADGEVETVIVKKATEFGEAEVWMNERLQRLGAKCVASYITAFQDKPPEAPAAGGNRRGRAPPPAQGDGEVWLVWRFEGPNTLWALMQKRDFPYNLEPLIQPLTQQAEDGTLPPKGPERKAAIYKTVMRQLLDALKTMHATGIVHRDIKPQNSIISERDARLKVIDLGAAADLRIGINYVPNGYLLDPRYAPPQQYVMSTQTVRPPPKPIAAFLSPILWFLESPDRFDMYSAGVTMLQLVFPNLRSDERLIAFNKQLDAFGYDLRRWRRYIEGGSGKGWGAPSRREWAEGLAILDADGGAGWDLLTRLMAYKPSDRPSAAEALSHPWLGGRGGRLRVVSPALANATRAVGDVVGDVVTNSIPETPLTEASLATLDQDVYEAPAGLTESQTVAWFKQRQQALSRKAERERGTGSLREQLGAGLRNTISNLGSSSSGSSSSSSSSSGSGSDGTKAPGMKAPFGLPTRLWRGPTAANNSSASEDDDGEDTDDGIGKGPGTKTLRKRAVVVAGAGNRGAKRG